MLIFGIGIVVGCIITLIISRTRNIGFLRVDTSDPDDGPYFFLELNTLPDNVIKRKYVTLKVNPNSYISQK